MFEQHSGLKVYDLIVYFLSWL